MVDHRPAQDAVLKLQIALDMFGLGESMMRQKLRRMFPGASDAQIEVKLQSWLAERPGAEDGDAPGRRRDLSR